MESQCTNWLVANKILEIKLWIFIACHSLAVCNLTRSDICYGSCLGVRLHIPNGHVTKLPIPTPLQTCRSLMQAALKFIVLLPTVN